MPLTQTQRPALPVMGAARSGRGVVPSAGASVSIMGGTDAA